jgi:hypothetical protein
MTEVIAIKLCRRFCSANLCASHAKPTDFVRWELDAGCRIPLVEVEPGVRLFPARTSYVRTQPLRASQDYEVNPALWDGRLWRIADIYQEAFMAIRFTED